MLRWHLERRVKRHGVMNILQSPLLCAHSKLFQCKVQFLNTLCKLFNVHPLFRIHFNTVNNSSQFLGTILPQDDGILDDLALTLVTDYPAMLFCIWFGMQDKLCEGGRGYSINTKKLRTQMHLFTDQVEVLLLLSAQH